MGLGLVESGIIVCKRHLEENGLKGTELETYITRSILINICATYETLIEEMFIQRAAKTKDKHIESFVKNLVSQKFRSVKVKKIRELLKNFGDDYVSSFNDILKDDDEALTLLSNMATNRDKVAHEPSAFNMTFDEVESSYYKSKKIISTISKVLEVPDPTA